MEKFGRIAGCLGLTAECSESSTHQFLLECLSQNARFTVTLLFDSFPSYHQLSSQGRVGSAPDGVVLGNDEGEVKVEVEADVVLDGKRIEDVDLATYVNQPYEISSSRMSKDP